MSRWQLPDWILGLLAALAILAMWEAYVITHRAETRGCGGNFAQYYVAGAILRQGEVERLYDQRYFQHLQESFRDDPLPSIYPPTVALLMAPLARFSHDSALRVWWMIHALCLLATGAIFYRTTPLARPWRINMLVALAGLMPLWIAVGIGQWAPIFLLVVAGGLTLHKAGQGGRAGLLLSLLALKPQLAAGLVLWMLLRRDFRTLLGLAAGFALQALTVAAVLGPHVWFDYLHAMPAISAATRRAHYSPMVETSFTGIASNVFWTAGLTAWEAVAMKIAYAVTVSAAVVALCRVVWSRRPLAGARPATDTPAAANYEYACGVMFMLLAPPYLIIYDQTLLAIPLVMLWSSPAWRWGVVLYCGATVLAANLSLAINFNAMGLLALATMFVLADGRLAAPARLQTPVPA